MTNPPFDLARAHRWFAVECNNEAWDLLESPSRTPDEVERMLHLAHASWFHWHAVGTPLNQLRAECLLSTAYGKAGIADGALRHAERCLALSHSVGDMQTAFDRATALGCAAAAEKLAGQPARADEFHNRAREAASKFTEPEEQAVFERLYGAL